ncbi:DUF302 domain-containing protein [Candidatus Parabeggiatoa sp. HSG14]|uniref:DUF302 domain-containing protein n=1 Tax=Candidatus Parabeggiatoa sp. HSG14 TaxID=3055593 RepID=UPI0025A79081|nr:DUF302 domain-containing protein [Thiotrichales bacterium HSG14]
MHSFTVAKERDGYNEILPTHSHLKNPPRKIQNPKIMAFTMQKKSVYSQMLTTPPVPKSRVSLIWFFLKGVKNLLAIIGLVLLGGLLLLYTQGQHKAQPFNGEFISFFGKFVEQVLKKDVASAMLIQIPLERGVTVEQAVKAMKNSASQLKIKLIGRYPLHKQIGKSSRFIEIFEFFDAATMSSLLNHNPVFAAYLPYKIALYEDSKHQIWFATLNIEFLLYSTQGINSKAKVQALKVQDDLLKIMGAGAYGVL